MAKLIEIYPRRRKHNTMGGSTPETTWHIREIEVRSEHIVLIRPDEITKELFVNGDLTKNTSSALTELEQEQEFSKITLSNSQEITVFGSIDKIKEKIIRDNKKMLFG